MTKKTKDKEVENVAEEVKQEQQPQEEKQEEKTKKEPQKASKKSKKDKSADKIKELEETILLKDDQHLRLQAEFDNYRKRTLKEKMELTKSAGESVLVNVLPVMDDFERALQSMEDKHEESAIKEGIDLIYKRLNDFLQLNGIKEIEAKEEVFDTDLHEAITKIPAPTEELKGKIVDVIQKGYMLNDKIIRFAKVVIGE
ncbi:MAG: nucleotide exchange factor GrpE [Prolixibacteraceae bacterium]|jgi:molecular chaperone GrpE|nr:nucleotide exchange factor GrpE [Prolixibacteraceae bacterium]